MACSSNFGSKASMISMIRLRIGLGSISMDSWFSATLWSRLLVTFLPASMRISPVWPLVTSSGIFSPMSTSESLSVNWSINSVRFFL